MYAQTHLTGEGDDARRRRLSVFRGWPWGSEGLRGGWKETDADDEFLCLSEGRPPSFEDCRELSTWKSSSEMDVRVVVLGAAEAAANCGDAPLSFGLPLAPEFGGK